MNRGCQVCKEPLFGRTDQKFCSDACRSHYHNLKNQKKNQNFYKTHRRLKNNYRILRRYATSQSTECNLSELNRQGFRPSSITGVERGFNGSLPKYYLYDIGYQFLNPEKIKIFKRANVD
jgi:predicted nucleic acid-binding Zn ribbon protein